MEKKDKDNKETKEGGRKDHKKEFIKMWDVRARVEGWGIGVLKAPREFKIRYSVKKKNEEKTSYKILKSKV